MPPKILVTLGCLAAVTPAFAQNGLKQDGLKHDSLKPAPRQITLLSTHDPVSDVCRRVDGLDRPATQACHLVELRRRVATMAITSIQEHRL